MNKEKIIVLKASQINLTELQDKLSQKRAEFDEQNRDLIESIITSDTDIESQKDSIKEDAKLEFKETGIKKLLGGIGIRVLNKISYSNENAINWAKDNMPVAIKEVLDKKQFETFAKSNDLGAWVTKEESVSVTFPKEIKLD